MLVSLSIIHFAYYFLNYVNGLLIIQLLTSNRELIQYKIEPHCFMSRNDKNMPSPEVSK